MRSARHILGLAVALALAPGALASDSRTTVDAVGDAVLRRTDSGNSGVVQSPSLPDLVSVTTGGWQASTPATDPYAGSWTDYRNTHLFKLEVVFAGLVNPPGPLGINGQPYAPHQFGPSPVYGFLDFDIDRDRNTGGEASGPAANRFLANVARFGCLPDSSIMDRAATSGAEVDFVFASSPQYERSGADFSLVLCGCRPVIVVSEGGDGNGVFDAGETWVLRGRFFQRAGGYAGASAVTGGTGVGMYDPLMNLRFRHDPAANTTTLTLVWALDNTGAAQLAGGGAAQANDTVIDTGGNQASLREALQDLIARAAWSYPDPAGTLIAGWRGRNAGDYLDPADWRVRAIVGTAYAQPTDAFYAWTDILGDCARGDFTGDELADGADRAVVQGYIASRDGGPDDADGVVNGAVVVPNPGLNFVAYDIDGDGVVGPLDAAFYGGPPPCPADWNRDGSVSAADITAYLGAWFSARAGAC